MKSRIFSALFSVIMISAAYCGDENFYASFDKTFTAEKAAGNPQGNVGEEINLETMGIYLQKGIKGKAMLTGVSEDGQKGFSCRFDAGKNISMKEGTVTLFVKPLNWNGKDERFQIFFEAASKRGQDRLLIYKYVNSDELLFLLGPSETKDGKHQWTIASASIKNWESGNWYFIACSWDKEYLKLYVNSKLMKIEKIKIPTKLDAFETFSAGPLQGANWKKIGGRTLVDELKIYDKALSQKEIFEEWENANINNTEKTAVPEISIGKSSPVLDGIINDNEYAFGSSIFFKLTGKLAPVRGRYFISRDDQNIYIAVKTQADETIRAECREHDSQLWTDDSVEIYLAPDPESPNYYQFVFNSKGICFDAKKGIPEWNGENIKTANSVKNGQWTFEAAIPFSSINTKAPTQSDTWKINICRTYPALKLYTATSPVTTGYNDIFKFTKINFPEEAAQIDIASLGDIDASDLDIAGTIRNKAGAEIKIETTVAIENEGKKLFDSQQESTIKAGEKIPLKIQKDKFGNDGVISINISEAKRRNLYSTVIPFSKEIPMVLDYVYTDIEKQIMKAVVKYKQPPFKSYPELKITVSDKNSKTALEKIFQADSQIYEADININTLAPGDYTLKLTALDRSKQEACVISRAFSKSPANPEWEGNKIGISDKIPPPWTAMKTDGTKISFWGRDYIFDSSIFPSSLINQKKEMLASPIRFTIAQNGKRENISAGKMTIVKESPDKVLAHSSGNACGFSFESDITVEFDGFTWIETEITPSSENISIDSLSFEIPLKPEFATLVHNCEKGYNFLKRGEGASGAVPAKGWYKNIFKKPIFWVGNEDIGIEWFAAELKNWNTSDREKSAQIIPGEKETSIKLNIIDHTVTIKEKFKIAFGFQASPVKALPTNWRKLRVTKDVFTWAPWEKAFNYPDPAYADIKKVQDIKKYSNGKEILWYFAIYGFSPLCPEWPYWSEKWEKLPPPRGAYMDAENPTWAAAYVCPHSESYRDFYMWKMEKTLKEMNFKNLYFDLGVPRSCYNTEHGCGWTDENGNMNETYNIQGTRELAKRIYTLLKERNTDALLMNHMTEEPVLPVLAFADMTADGENYCQELAEKETYADILTPELFRAAYMSRQWGFVSTFIPQFERSSLAYRPSRAEFWKKDPEAQKAFDHYIGLIVLHDANSWPQFGVKLDKIWKLQNEFGWDEKVEFLPYWDKTNPVKASGNIMTSVYRREGKGLIVVFNNTDQEEDAIVTLDKDKLFNGAAPENLKAADALNKEPYKIEDDSISLKVPARNYRLIILN